MAEPESNSSQAESLRLLGIDLDVIENLKNSQKALAAKGFKRTLEEIYVLEVGPLPEPEQVLD
jgi:hypothetical protein